MALPLLLLAGAGILGGGGYLLKKADQRRAESMLGAFEEQLANSPFANTPYGQQMQQMAQGIVQNNSLLDGSASQDIESMMAAVTNNTLGWQNAQANRAVQSGALREQNAMAYQNDVQADSRAARERWGGIQNTARSMVELIDTGQANAFEATRLIYQYLDLLAPGEIKTEADINAIANAGGAIGALAQKWLTAMGSPDVVNDQFLQGLRRDVLSIAGGEQERWNRVDANIRERLANNPYADLVDYRNVVGSEYGIDPAYQLPEQMPYQQPAVSAGAVDTNAALAAENQQLRMQIEAMKNGPDYTDAYDWQE